VIGLISLSWENLFQSSFWGWGGVAACMCHLFHGFLELVMFGPMAIVCLNYGECHYVKCKDWDEGLLWVGFLGCLRVLCV